MTSNLEKQTNGTCTSSHNSNGECEQLLSETTCNIFGSLESWWVKLIFFQCRN